MRSPIAAVAGATLDAARRTAAELPIEITPVPFVIDPDTAGSPGAPHMYGSSAARRRAPNSAENPVLPARWNGNVRGPSRMPWLGTLARRRVAAARRSSSAGYVALNFETAAQLHSSFEPHVTVADWSDPDRLRVCTSTQAVDHVTHDLADRFGLDEDAINSGYVLEQSIDQAAHQLGSDPIELRRGWDGNAKRRALYDWASELPVWRDRPVTGSQQGRHRRGVGVAAANWFYFVDPGTEIEVSVRSGALVVRNAVQDMGTGSKTLLARAVASVFDVDPTEVIVEVGRAGRGMPHGPTSGGSRTTASIWSTAVEAATKLKAIVGADWRTADGVRAAATRGGDRSMRAVPISVANLQIGRGFTAAVHVTEVEVATISPAASVGNAIFNATGFRPTVLPVRPDPLLEGLR